MEAYSFQFLSSFIAITIPLLFFSALISDRNSRLVVLFLCWGTFAGMLAFGLETLLGIGGGQGQAPSFVIIPVIEEVCKGLSLLLFLNKKLRPNDPRTLIYCAIAAGIGFSIQESLYYFTLSAHELGDIVTLVARTLSTALMHAMTTGFIGIGFAVLQRQRRFGILMCVGLFLAAACIHIAYNALIVTDYIVVGLIIPYLMFVVMLLYLRKL